MRYKVIKECISHGGKKHYEVGDITHFDPHTKYVKKLIKYGFIKEVEGPDFEAWGKYGVKSKLANVVIAPKDYAEGDKKHFTWEEACAIRSKLNNGWRLPTRHEWALICEEFANSCTGALSSKLLENKLGLDKNGFKDGNGSLRAVGLVGYYWSSTASTNASNAYNLSFNASNTYPSFSDARWVGFSVRLVKDLEDK